mmetsp:Transcript_15391/g.31780  ORF Transcript_15391/g.31780 Transcript_15391/m.31780 type:complete len:152 (-) Transcript_15391:562-1017(-)
MMPFHQSSDLDLLFSRSSLIRSIAALLFGDNEGRGIVFSIAGLLPFLIDVLVENGFSSSRFRERISLSRCVAGREAGARLDKSDSKELPLLLLEDERLWVLREELRLSARLFCCFARPVELSALSSASPSCQDGEDSSPPSSPKKSPVPCL